jgi:cytochrome c oxidase subunit 2
VNPTLLTTTQAVDPVFMLIFGICLALLLGITGAMVWFVVRYHKSRSPEPTSEASGNIWLEMVWTVLPTLLVLAMFYYGWSGYLSLRTVPKGALPVTATARMWSWSFTYDNGRTSPKLYVPVGRPVLVDLVSKDVLHGFYIPAFRVKRDVVPGMKNHVWFMAPKAGSYDLFCSQYCGMGHSAMITTVEALPPDRFDAWLQEGAKGGAGGTAAGRAVLEKHGCLGCHSLDGSPRVGPTLKGLFGSTVKVTKDGTPLTVAADEAFLRESIRHPAATVVEGFPPVMPPDPTLTEDEVAAVVTYLKGLK